MGIKQSRNQGPKLSNYILQRIKSTKLLRNVELCNGTPEH